MEGSDFCRFDDEARIAAHWAHADNLEFMLATDLILQRRNLRTRSAAT